MLGFNNNDARKLYYVGMFRKTLQNFKYSLYIISYVDLYGSTAQKKIEMEWL